MIIRSLRISTTLAAAIILSGCASITENGIDLSRITSPFQRNSEAVPSFDRPGADARGVITYEDYQVIVAREGDSLTSIANRIGLTATELAETNGLPLRYEPRAGEVLVLPVNVGGNLVSSPSGWSEEIAISAIENVSNTSAPEVGSPTAPLRHRVEAGETAYEIARNYNVSVTALASWNGLGSDLGVRTGQQLIIPVPDTNLVPAVETPAPAPAPTPAPEITAPVVVAEPAPAPVATNPNAPFVLPVAGTVLRGYQPSGRDKNEGIDYQTEPLAVVVAAGDGTIALVSESLGGLGTIILIRHSNDLMTVYGRIGTANVAKGDTVRKGQTIGRVAPGDPPTLHFEVRVGTESVNPAQYLP
ncbi:MAG: M23 family metallopeptidase [Rhodobacteraceae bacterium]|nr:M23 family metallopeptidase [Paracoccaceae bacterium]